MTLAGRKGLVTGIANDRSIAWGCARAFRHLGADLAVTCLNERAKPHVEPLAAGSRRTGCCPWTCATKASWRRCSRP